MEAWVLAGAAVGIVGLTAAAVVTWLRYRAAWDEAVRQVASRHGLTLTAPRWPGLASASGTVDGLDLTVDTYTVQHGKGTAQHARIRVTGGQPPHLSLAQENAFSVLNKALNGPDLEVGDPAFDRAVLVRGPTPVEVSSLCGPEARAAFRAAVAKGASLQHGEWRFEEDGLIGDPGVLEAIVGRLLAAAAAGRDRPGLREGLAARVASDPEPGVRRAALQRGMDLWTAEELRSWAADPDPVVAALAADGLGEEGRERLVALLDAPDPEAARLAAVALSRRPPGPERDRLASWLLDGLGPTWPEGIEALGRVGTAAAVPALHGLADGVLAVGEVPRRAREAIRAIQARITTGEGAVSLAPETGGGLSEAPVSAGRRRVGEET